MQYESPLTRRIPGSNLSFHSRPLTPRRHPRWDLEVTEHTSNVSPRRDAFLKRDCKIVRPLRMRIEGDLEKIQSPGKLHSLGGHDVLCKRPEPETFKCFSKIYKREKKSKKKSKTKRVSKERTPLSKEPKTITTKSWDFGKTKSFTRPDNNAQTNAAAIQIQRIARGGWQRLKYRIAVLQRKLDSHDTDVSTELDRIKQRLEKRKARYHNRMQVKFQAESDKYELQKREAAEANQIISYLRKEQRKLQREGDMLRRDMVIAKAQHDHLLEANKQAKKSFLELRLHTNHLVEVYDQLRRVIPQYQSSIKHLENSKNNRHHSCEAEHNIKIKYFSCVGSMVEKIEERCEDATLVNEVVKYCLDL